MQILLIETLGEIQLILWLLIPLTDFVHSWHILTYFHWMLIYFCFSSLKQCKKKFMAKFGLLYGFLCPSPILSFRDFFENFLECSHTYALVHANSTNRNKNNRNSWRNSAYSTVTYAHGRFCLFVCSFNTHIILLRFLKTVQIKLHGDIRFTLWLLMPLADFVWSWLFSKFSNC